MMDETRPICSIYVVAQIMGIYIYTLSAHKTSEHNERFEAQQMAKQGMVLMNKVNLLLHVTPRDVG